MVSSAARRTVVLADDHLLVRAGLRSLIEDFGAYEVVGEADDGERAVELVRECGAVACGVAMAVELVRFGARAKLAERGVPLCAPIQL